MTELNNEPTNNIDINADAENLNSEEMNVEVNLEGNSEESPTDTNQSTEVEVQSNVNLEKEKMTDVNSEKINKTEDEIHEIEEISELTHFEEDLSNYSKNDFVNLADKMLEALKSRTISVSDVKNIDNAVKVIRSAFDEINNQEIKEAKKEYIAQNGSDEGFQYKNDNHTIRFEGILIQIREQRQNFFNKLEREREDYFEIKTRLLQQLRETVETEEKGESKNNWETFKALQTAWKNAGNINSPHNGTLWSAYNALVDRYFDIRSIQNELKELDRKKNIINKEGLVIKIEAIAESLAEQPLNNLILKNANDLLNEYKQIGPGPREEQDALWERMKKSFDVIYSKKRELAQENQALTDEIFNAKSQILENLKPYLSFNSDSINEWNAKSKEVIAIQEQWNAIKGPLPKDKAKDISKEFWADLKTFFKNKSEFFAKLEAKREDNYKAKEQLCLAADEILATNDHSAPNTNKIIELQKQWKSIGHVPEKYKDTLYNRFKATCDKYFDLKRNESKAQDEEYAKNLADKIAICEKIEKLSGQGHSDLSELAEFKKSFAAIGFVPRKEMQNIQNRFISAVNAYVKSSTGIDIKEKDKIMLQNEVEVVMKTSGGSKNLDKQESDIRRKIKGLEEEISLTKNNMEFFGHSKNADKLKAEYLKKVVSAEKELSELQAKLKLIIAAN